MAVFLNYHFKGNRAKSMVETARTSQHPLCANGKYSIVDDCFVSFMVKCWMANGKLGLPMGQNCSPSLIRSRGEATIAPHRNSYVFGLQFG